MTLQPPGAFEPPSAMAVPRGLHTEIVQAVPGCLGHASARTAEGPARTAASFLGRGSLAVRREEPEHRKAGSTGRADWQESRTPRIATVERSHGCVRNG
ncbi:antibiotic biosynthesis monooxygenase [Streptomyces sp. PCS3-D2]|uniref:hypothetical protein n=1 Tax=Streptomyces sp. PCS3-D2 TaxID=1460244 RepID=UPI00055FDDD0|nr:hypothetical protein [Streptomyces sp. PCS3-D2]WKV73160.1 antibiotic biosynthesis monooxygenase [Streptomyces sp. PCS3-D2]